MSQHDYNLANAAGLAFRSDLNNVLAAIISQNSATTEPTTTVAYMFWADTTTAILKQRNAGNSAWISLFNMTTGQWLGAISGNAATVTVADAAADTTTWPMLATSQTGNMAPATDAGLTYNASTNTFNNLATTGIISSSSPTAGIGYAAGAGASPAAVNQAATVTANAMTGVLSINSATYTAGTLNNIIFVNNSSYNHANGDVVLIHGNTATEGLISLAIRNGTNQFIIQAYCAITITQPLVYNFVIIKGSGS